MRILIIKAWYLSLEKHHYTRNTAMSYHWLKLQVIPRDILFTPRMICLKVVFLDWQATAREYIML